MKLCSHVECSLHFDDTTPEEGPSMNVIKRFALMLAAIVLPMLMLSGCGQEFQTTTLALDATKAFIALVALLALAGICGTAIAVTAIIRSKPPKQSATLWKASSTTRRPIRNTGNSNANNDNDSWADSDGGGD